MTMDLNNEGSMFAPTPVWERGGKKRRGATTVRPERATFAEPTDTATTRDMTAASTFGAATVAAPMGHEVYREERTVAPTATTDTMTSDAPFTAPRRTTTTRRAGPPVGALVGGLAAIVALGAAGWYATQPHDSGVATLTPGATESSQAALATAPMGGSTTTSTTTTVPGASQAQLAATTPAPAVTTTRRTTATRVAVRAPAPTTGATSAAEVGVDTSATLPQGPQPYASGQVTTAPEAPAASTTMSPAAPAAPDTTSGMTSTAPPVTSETPAAPAQTEAAPAITTP